MSKVQVAFIAAVVVFSSNCFAMQYTTRYDYNLDYQSLTGKNLPSSKTQWADGMDVYVNMSIENNQSYNVTLWWRATWYRPDGTEDYQWTQSSAETLLANDWDHYYCNRIGYPVIPGNWRVVVEVKERPAGGSLTNWQTVVDEYYLVVANTYTISGYVKDGSNNAVVGATMSGLPTTPATNGIGFYSDTVSYGWIGTVTPSKAGYSFSPSSRPYGGVTSNRYNQDYTGTLLPPTIAKSKDTLSPTCMQGQNAASEMFEIWNSGSNTLNYTVFDNVGWLECTPGSGSSTGGHNTITVTYSTSGLGAGTYPATITIDAPGATNNQQTISVNLTVSALPQVATPTFSPDGGTYTGSQSVVVSCAISGATIHYTTNGVDPTESDSTIASGSSITVDQSLTLKAKAWKTGYTPSQTKTGNYTINVPTATISGFIRFVDRAGTPLSNLPQGDERKSAVPQSVTITVWPAVPVAGDGDVYEWPFVQAPTQQFSFGNFASPYLTTALTPGKYLIGVSVYGGIDQKILRFEIQNPPINITNADIVLTLEDVRSSDWWRVGADQWHYYTFTVASDFLQSEKEAIVNAVQAWASTGLVSFSEDTSPSPFPGTNHISFVKKDGGLPDTLLIPIPGMGYKVSLPKGYYCGRDMKYVVDTGSHRIWQVHSGNPGLEAIVVHEIGHVVGLRYPPVGEPQQSDPDLAKPDSIGEQWSAMSYLGQTPWLGWSDVWSLGQLKDKSWKATTTCPVDLEIEDSLGRIVSKTVNEIPGATYVEADLDGDGHLDDQVTIPDPCTGGYSIRVIPEAGALPDDKVTLTVEDHGQTSILLDEVRVADLPVAPVVKPVDRTPPTLSISVDPNMLAPVRGQMVPVIATVSAWDEDPDIVVALAGISSSEPNDVNFVDGADFGTLDTDFALRASSRPDELNGRTYTITYAASDSTGNVSYASVTVTVPKVGVADINRDGTVDFLDFAILAGNWMHQECTTPNWCSDADFDRDASVDYLDLAFLASHWLEGVTVPITSEITWVSINDPGVSGHEGFNGQMSKYETTNAQYCQFLNAALASNAITVYTDNKVYATSDTSHSLPYYDLAGTGYTTNGGTNGGAARINYTGGQFTVDSGFENHPVTYVSWYGATAFCNYYGYRLPTEWEWQAVADCNGSYNYGCGIDINNSIANYYNSSHPNGTTDVGAFGAYGYGICDLTGNVWEWTSTVSDTYRVIRGGCWDSPVSYCTVLRQYNLTPNDMNGGYGFRVCRDVPIIWAGNGHYYLVVSGNWEQAEALAVAMGGHLVTVNDANEQQWLVNTFGPIDQDSAPNSFWIGYTDREVNGVWKWSSDDTSTYTYWYSGEPNGGTAYPDEAYVYIGRYSGGGWNDTVINTINRGVAEFESPPIR